MATGHKTKDGKFHPHTPYREVRKSRDQTAKTQGVRLQRNPDKSETRTYKVWHYEDAPEEVQEKILENWRNNYSGQDTFYAEDEGILYDTKENFAGHEAFKNVIPKYWDLEGGRQFIQFELEIKDEKKLASYLGIPEKLRNKIDFHFENDREANTRIYFTDVMGSTIDLTDDIHSYDDKDNFYDVSEEDKPTLNEFRLLLQAHDKWMDLMDMSLKHLIADYEWEFSDEYIEEHVKSNEYFFNEDGKIDSRR